MPGSVASSAGEDKMGPAVVPDKRASSARKSGTHSQRKLFGEDTQLPVSRHDCSLWLWVPAPVRFAH
ncbi:hypothetical protein ABIA03_005574 [Bradyrhizobium yuanmingense]|uniref:Transposase n=1 Tax=Bradyrhizobium yuanmingense TaxID=108015 RepID=A0ABV4GC61_9BRAD